MKCFGVGRLTRDPELRYTTGGNAVCNFGMAFNESYKKQSGEKVEETNFFDYEIWGKRAEVINEYCSKGDQLLVEAKAKQDTWETDGQKRSKVVFKVLDFEFIGGGKSNKESETVDKESEEAEETQEGGVPF